MIRKSLAVAALTAAVCAANAQMSITSTFYGYNVLANAGNNVDLNNAGAWPSNPLGITETATDALGGHTASSTADASGTFSVGPLSTFSLAADVSVQEDLFDNFQSRSTSESGFFFTVASTGILSFAGTLSQDQISNCFFEVFDVTTNSLVYETPVASGAFSDSMSLSAGNYKMFAFCRDSTTGWNDGGSVSMSGSFGPPSATPEPVTTLLGLGGVALYLRRARARRASRPRG